MALEKQGTCLCGATTLKVTVDNKANDFHAVPVGLLDGDQAWDFNLQIFVEEKPAWYCFANQTKELTGQEVFEQNS
ncbi:GFA family protein [Pseudomonas monteilii]|uniref:hypothetical protein n=1 Tax=Pseudomonas monteilii TaxID=76759 RepID=UPI0018A38EC3|nr:hypothetical protein [Pseudomonas monteilii]BBV98247.1 hypothetical protein STW0522PSE72_35980 [Pseudomonas monteilii]